MEDAAAVGILDRVADVEEPAQELAQFQRTSAGIGLENRIGVERGDRVLEAVAADEPHGVIRPAVAVRTQTVDRDDPRMFESAGDLSLHEKAGAVGWVVGVAIEDLLEGDLTIELAVERDKHGSETAFGVRTQHPEPSCLTAGRVDRVQGRHDVAAVRPGRAGM